MEQSEIQHLLSPILWDYQIDPYEFFEVATGQRDHVGWFTRERAVLRMLERLAWYDLVRLFGTDELTRLLTKDLIGKIRIKALQERYELVRKVLHGEPVSSSGWSPEYREKIQQTLLSHRWYRAQ
jgi:hypothetical protein